MSLLDTELARAIDTSIGRLETRFPFGWYRVSPTFLSEIRAGIDLYPFRRYVGTLGFPNLTDIWWRASSRGATAEGCSAPAAIEQLAAAIDSAVAALTATHAAIAGHQNIPRPGQDRPLNIESAGGK